MIRLTLSLLTLLGIGSVVACVTAFLIALSELERQRDSIAKAIGEAKELQLASTHAGNEIRNAQKEILKISNLIAGNSESHRKSETDISNNLKALENRLKIAEDSQVKKLELANEDLTKQGNKITALQNDITKFETISVARLKDEIQNLSDNIKISKANADSLSQYGTSFVKDNSTNKYWLFDTKSGDRDHSTVAMISRKDTNYNVTFVTGKKNNPDKEMTSVLKVEGAGRVYAEEFYPAKSDKPIGKAKGFVLGEMIIWENGECWVNK